MLERNFSLRGLLKSLAFGAQARVGQSSIDIPFGHRCWSRPDDLFVLRPRPLMLECNTGRELIRPSSGLDCRFRPKTHSGGIVADSWGGERHREGA
jgi:hypothetical protein